ncbi:MAG TPA: hypothetical protein DCZ03_08005, partial [Gammaproteobacteria bacterium]|nr:hypothetical protein [Gammaproteobacteria bacterium]
LTQAVTQANTLEHWVALDSDYSLADLMDRAAAMRDQGHSDVVSYSKKVFIPLTQLCRDVCHYCTFAKSPKELAAPYLPIDEVIKIAKAGEQAGCQEALFTLGDNPEARYRTAREWLNAEGFASTLDYLAHAAKRVAEETRLLPHLNPGLMNLKQLQQLREVSASMGMMLESSSQRLLEKGQVHYGSPDKVPARRLACIEAAGEVAIPFTSGILIGIGETKVERLESLLVLKALHDRYGHLQEVIIQNFRAKQKTKLANALEPGLEELLWTIAMARLIFGPEMNIQAPPNLSPGVLPQLIGAGINDWGGVSPVTPDYVNPEAPWPHLLKLKQETAEAGKLLVQRLTAYPAYVRSPDRWFEPAMQSKVMAESDAQGYARGEGWAAGALNPLPRDQNNQAPKRRLVNDKITSLLQKAVQQESLSETDIVTLFETRGDAFESVCDTADQLRQQVVGDTVTYVVNRNINYTNVCYFRCQFCAFSKGKASENLRGKPYVLSHDEIARRTLEAWQRGATEVCLQGGIHPQYSGQTYIDICHTIKQAVPDIHIHAFSPLEIWQGANTLNLSVQEYLIELKAAGLGSLPGTAAEILDDEVRARLCPDKINTTQWLEIIETAHDLHIPTTATIMFGHLDAYHNWARHLLHLKRLQARTGGFTELAMLPFVHMYSPIYLKGRARRGPTFRETVLMHAVARVVLHPHFKNIQTSWTKLGKEGALRCLHAGANDIGGTLMNETITRAAGASHGQENAPRQMEQWIQSIARTPAQRTTLYGEVPTGQRERSYIAAPLEDPRYQLASQFERSGNKPTLLRADYSEQIISGQEIV